MPIYVVKTLHKLTRFRSRENILTGAKGVAWCFSAASMSTENTRAEVMNISMKTPCAELIPWCRVVLESDSSVKGG